MKIYIFFTTFLKKINQSINTQLKKFFNRLSINNLSYIAQSNKFFLTFILLIFLFLLYLLIPNTYDKANISKQLNDQIEKKLNLKFNLSEKLEYNFFPRPHFIFKNSSILINKTEISKIKILKIYFSLNNLFSFKNIKINDLIVKNSNFNLNKKSYDFFINLLSEDYKNGSFTIKDSNIFFRNKDDEVLFINKIINMKYYYDTKETKNFIFSKNEIFNIPFTLELNQNKFEKKINSKLNLNFLKLQIENNINYNDSFKKGFMIINLDQNKSNLTYDLMKNSLNFNLFDKLKKSKFSYHGNINFSPFYSELNGKTDEINLSKIFKFDNLILQLIKTKILNHKNLNFILNINAKKTKSYNTFNNFILNSQIKEGLIDIDNTEFSWKNNVNFKISESLIYIKEGEVILDAKLNLKIKKSYDIFAFLLTPKKYRNEIKKINLNFIYNFDKKILSLNQVKIDDKFNKSVEKTLKNFIFKNDKLQNKIYIKNVLNRALKVYAG